MEKESSPYLLQHAKNPVHWQPWKKDAYQEFNHEKKLVIVSIGYSSCHWCHVMEEETFEDARVADFMNKNFINIKVDAGGPGHPYRVPFRDSDHLPKCLP